MENINFENIEDLDTKVRNIIESISAISRNVEDLGDKNLKGIKTILEVLDEAYYNDLKSLISDELYDELKGLYLSLTGQKEYDYVPGSTTTEDTYVHTEHILSLDKVNDLDELRKEMERLVPFIIEPKYDGLTVVVYPNADIANNSYIAVTRGNGEEGDIITNSIKALNAINENYVKLIRHPIRFEAYMRKSVMAKLNEEREINGEDVFKNTRNAAAGVLKNNDINNVKGVELVAYNLVGANAEMSESDQLNYLHRHGISVPDPRICFKCNSKDDIDKALDFVVNFDRDSLDYDIDGLVIKANYKGSLEALGGNTSHHPKNAVAYKFKAQGVWTVLKDVVWQTGRTGKITPVGIVEPVQLLGAEVSKSTLHNIAYINKLNLKINKAVYLIKSNDVIPAITDCKALDVLPAPVEVDVPLPTVCPECSGQVQLKGDQLFCTNAHCKAKLLNKIVHYAHRNALNIEGLAISTAEKMIDAGYIKYPTDIFKVTAEEIASLEGYAKKSGTKLYNAIQRARVGVNLEKFIYAAGIPNVGRGTSKDLAQHYKSFANMVVDIKNGCLEMRSIPDIGQTTIDSIIANTKMLGMLFAVITPTDMPTPKITKAATSGKSFCITGTLSRPRSEIAHYINSCGHSFIDRVNNSVDYLVVGDKVGQNKIDAAKKKGIQIISEQDLYNLLDT